MKDVNQLIILLMASLAQVLSGKIELNVSAPLCRVNIWTLVFLFSKLKMLLFKEDAFI